MPTILSVAADYEDSLFASVNLGDTTATLTSAVDEDGVALANSTYGFTIDNNSPQKEYIIATLTGTLLTNVFNVSRQGVATAGFGNFHRKGATVEITNWAALSRVVGVLNGSVGLDAGNPLFYDGAPALGSANQLATVQYVLDHINGGAVSFNAEIVSGMAGETITIGQWVYLKESDGRWYKTAANDISKCLGVKVGKALGAGTAGGAIASGVFIQGLETSGTYSAFTTYYLSDTPGAVGTSAGTNSVQVGISDANSKLIVSKISTSHINALAGTVGIPSGVNKYLTVSNEFVDTDQSQTGEDTATAFGAANTTGNKNLLAQSFIPTLVKIRGGKLYKTADTGSFTGTVTISLQADATGSPSGTDLASVTITNAVWLTIPVGEFVATFGTEYSSLAIESPYWIVATASTASNTAHPNLGTNSVGGYANGVAKYKNTTDGWVLLSGVDLYFKTLGGVDSQVPLTGSAGLISQQIAASTILLNDIVPGTNVNTTVTETTSYSGTIDTSVFAKTSGAIKIKFNFTLVLNTSTSSPTVTIRTKIGGITLATWISPVGVTGAGSANCVFELRFTGAGVYIYDVMGGNSVVIATASTQNLITIFDSARGTVSNFPPLSGNQPLLVTVQPSQSSANTGAQVLDMTVTTM